MNYLLFTVLTVLVYLFSRSLYRKTEFFLFNPVLISIIIMIPILLFFDVKYENYFRWTSPINIWLQPSIVALAIPFYFQLDKIIKEWKRLIFAMLNASCTCIVSTIILAKYWDIPTNVILSLVPKSITTPIALSVSETLGGVDALTTLFVVIVGIVGAIFGELFLKIIRCSDPQVVGLSMGACSHAIGTAKVAKKGEVYGAYAALGLILNGIITAMIAPLLTKIFL